MSNVDRYDPTLSHSPSSGSTSSVVQSDTALTLADLSVTSACAAMLRNWPDHLWAYCIDFDELITVNECMGLVSHLLTGLCALTSPSLHVCCYHSGLYGDIPVDILVDWFLSLLVIIA